MKRKPQIENHWKLRIHYNSYQTDQGNGPAIAGRRLEEASRPHVRILALGRGFSSRQLNSPLALRIFDGVEENQDSSGSQRQWRGDFWDGSGSGRGDSIVGTWRWGYRLSRRWLAPSKEQLRQVCSSQNWIVVMQEWEGWKEKSVVHCVSKLWTEREARDKQGRGTV